MRLLFTPTLEGTAHTLSVHYAKVSEREVAGNVAAGGRGMETQAALHALVEKRYPAMGEAHRQAMAEALFHQLLEQSQRFCNVLLREERALMDGYRRLFGRASSLDFFNGCVCIDVAPVWDEAVGRFRFELIEAQPHAAIEGLEQVYPEAAKRHIQDLRNPRRLRPADSYVERSRGREFLKAARWNVLATS